MMSQTAIHSFNNFLSYVVILLAFYIIATPFVPELNYSIQVHAQTTQQQPPEHSKENRVIINKIGVDAPILEGTNAAILDQGIWRRPASATPGAGSNTVLVGHRFLYTSGPTTFYHLPKLTQGDTITILWNNEVLVYEVYETRIVLPTESLIESPTDEETLTLYTCTPLWNPTHRFVVRAKLV